MKKCIALSGLFLLSGILFITGCKDGGDPKPVVAEAILYNGEEIANNAVIELQYGEEINLNTLFSIDPAKAQGTLKYTLVEQPAYMDITTDNQYVEVNAWTLTGSTLNSIARVPDALTGVPGRTREVQEGKLKVELIGGAQLSPLEVFIVQTDKPAIESIEPAVVSIVDNEEYTDAPDGNGNKLKTLTATDGDWTSFSLDLFNVMPLDYNRDRILVRACPNAEYIVTTSAGAVRTAGDKTKSGTGEYVVGFYCAAKGENETDDAYQARVTATYDAAVASGTGRIYVNLEAFVEPDAVVGIVLNTEAIGTAGAASFWTNTTNQRKMPASFVLAKLNNGETRAWNTTNDGILMVGEFSTHMEGRTKEYTDEDFPGWWSYAAIKAAYTALDTDCPVGTDLSFKITHKDHYNETAWTVQVETERLAGNPAA